MSQYVFEKYIFNILFNILYNLFTKCLCWWGTNAHCVINIALSIRKLPGQESLKARKKTNNNMSNAMEIVNDDSVSKLRYIDALDYKEMDLNGQCYHISILQLVSK